MRVYAVQGNITFVTKKKCSETYPRRELHTRTELVEEADDFVDICLRLAIGRHTTVLFDGIWACVVGRHSEAYLVNCERFS